MADCSREFPTIVVASALTGIGLGDIPGGFSAIAEIASYLFGAPIWTHELVHEPTYDAYREEGYRQFPDMPTSSEAEQDWRQAAAKALAAYGPTVTVAKGAHGRRESPTDTAAAVAPHATIIPIIVGDGNG